MYPAGGMLCCSPHNTSSLAAASQHRRTCAVADCGARTAASWYAGISTWMLRCCMQNLTSTPPTRPPCHAGAGAQHPPAAAGAGACPACSPSTHSPSTHSPSTSTACSINHDLHAGVTPEGCPSRSQLQADCCWPAASCSQCRRAGATCAGTTGSLIRQGGTPTCSGCFACRGAALVLCSDSLVVSKAVQPSHSLLCMGNVYGQCQLVARQRAGRDPCTAST